MPPPSPDERLAARRYLTVVLRVLVDRRGELIHAEVVAPAGAMPRRVSQWREIEQLVRASVDAQRSEREL